MIENARGEHSTDSPANPGIDLGNSIRNAKKKDGHETARHEDEAAAKRSGHAEAIGNAFEQECARKNDNKRGHSVKNLVPDDSRLRHLHLAAEIPDSFAERKQTVAFRTKGQDD